MSTRVKNSVDFEYHIGFPLKKNLKLRFWPGFSVKYHSVRRRAALRGARPLSIAPDGVPYENPIIPPPPSSTYSFIHDVDVKARPPD